VMRGAELEYTSHYTLKEFDLIGREDGSQHGVLFGPNVSDMTFVDPVLENFETGMLLTKDFKDPVWEAEVTHDYTLINPTFIDVENELGDFDPKHDQVLQTEDLPNYTPDVVLDKPLTFALGDPSVDPDALTVSISGTKTDSLGETGFASGTDDYTLNFEQARDTLKEEGYYSTSDGQNYFVLDLYFSDRVTGDIYVEKHPVFLADNVEVENPWHWAFGGTPFNGVQDLGVEGDPTSDEAELWATLTDGQLVLAENPEPDEEMEDGEVLMAH